jgi:hypothetical protein
MAGVNVSTRVLCVVLLVGLGNCGRNAPSPNEPASPPDRPSSAPREADARKSMESRMADVLKRDHARVVEMMKELDDRLAQTRLSAVAAVTEAAAGGLRSWNDVLDDAKNKAKTATPGVPAAYPTFSELALFMGYHVDPAVNRNARTINRGAFDFRYFVPVTREDWAHDDEDGDVALRREFVLVLAVPTAQWWSFGASTCLVGAPGQPVLGRTFPTLSDAASWRPPAIGACPDRGTYWRSLGTTGWTAWTPDPAVDAQADGAPRGK